MGYWGIGILENDNANGFINSYLDLYDKGYNHSEIRLELEKLYLENGTYTYEDWLYLAYCQWKCGFLEDDVLKKVEEIIENETDRSAWISGEAIESDVKKREKKLSQFFEKIKVANPKPLKRKTK
jgi:hypothetical protein